MLQICIRLLKLCCFYLEIFGFIIYDFVFSLLLLKYLEQFWIFDGKILLEKTFFIKIYIFCCDEKWKCVVSWKRYIVCMNGIVILNKFFVNHNGLHEDSLILEFVLELKIKSKRLRLSNWKMAGGVEARFFAFCAVLDLIKPLQWCLDAFLSFSNRFGVNSINHPSKSVINKAVKYSINFSPQKFSSSVFN